jgi:ATP-binding cassette subfamily C (CFTR/MRP) protein 1
LGAIARLKDFEAETEVEGKACENLIPPENWPSRGLLEIEGVSVEYK